MPSKVRSIPSPQGGHKLHSCSISSQPASQPQVNTAEPWGHQLLLVLSYQIPVRAEHTFYNHNRQMLLIPCSCFSQWFSRRLKASIYSEPSLCWSYCIFQSYRTLPALHMSQKTSRKLQVRKSGNLTWKPQSPSGQNTRVELEWLSKSVQIVFPEKHPWPSLRGWAECGLKPQGQRRR